MPSSSRTVRAILYSASPPQSICWNMDGYFMKSEHRVIVLGFTLPLLACLLAYFPSAEAAPQKSQNQSVQRGEYIVNDVAMCGQCHTPRTSTGSLDRSRWLEGAPIWLEPAAPTANWPLTAPRIAGTPPAGDADLISLLTTGTWRGGERLRLPMPQFRMSREDAEAVVAYLRSLNPSDSAR